MAQFHQLHLNKFGSGMASKTACGRSLMRTPMSANWDVFKAESPEYQCEKCKESKFFSFMIKEDAKKNPGHAPETDDLDNITFEPVDDPDSWIDADNKFLRK